jgi:hypothetical protein
MMPSLPQLLYACLVHGREDFMRLLLNRVMRLFCAAAAGALFVVPAAADVMPQKYAFVVTGYESGADDDGNFGELGRWNHIRLWGKAKVGWDTCVYRWEYGNGSKDAGSNDGWKSITSANRNNLVSDEITSFTVRPEDNARGFSTYKAKLVIKKTAGASETVDDESLTVTVVDFAHLDPGGIFTRDRAKWAIVNQIAVGRALKWLYLKQNAINGSWNVVSRGQDYPTAGTAITLMAFTRHGHGRHDNAGNKDIFSDSLEQAKVFLLRQLKTHPSSGGIQCAESASSAFPHYQLPLIASALASFQNSDTMDDTKFCSVVDGNFSYRNILQRIALYIESAQHQDPHVDAVGFDPTKFATTDPYGTKVYKDYSRGSWTYTRPQDSLDSKHRPDLSITVLMVEALAALERDWGITPPHPENVRDALRDYLTCMQFQSDALPNTPANDPYKKIDGSARYYWVHAPNPVPVYNDVVTEFFSYYAPYPYANTDIAGAAFTGIYGLGSQRDKSLALGASAIMAIARYVGQDTTTTGLVQECLCGNPACNDATTDCSIAASYGNSCQRIRGALAYLGRRQTMPTNSSEQKWCDALCTFYAGADDSEMPAIYNMYHIRKTLENLGYTRYADPFTGNPGVNAGRLPLNLTGDDLQPQAWEDLFESTLVRMQSTDESTDGSFPGLVGDDDSGEDYIGNIHHATAWAVNVLGTDTFVLGAEMLLRTDARKGPVRTAQANPPR